MAIVLGFGTGPNAARKNNKAMKTLTRDCDPGPLLEVCRRQLANTKLCETSPRIYAAMVFNLLDASIARGAGVAPLNLLKKIQSDSELAGPACGATHWLYVSRANRVEERWEEAAAAQTKAMELFGRGGATQEAEQSLQWWLCLNGYAIRIHAGQTEGAEEQLKTLFATAPDNWHKVENHLLLGKLYVAQGRADEARTELGHVITHGNKLFAKTEAEDLLRGLAGEGPDVKKRLRDARQRVELELEHMSNTCDPTPAWEYCQAALADKKILREKGSCLLHWYACTALTNLGRYEEARKHLEQVEPGALAESREVDRLVRLHRQILIDTAQGGLHEAAQAQNEAMRLFADEKAEVLRQALCVSGCALQIKLGQLDGVEERAKGLLENAEDELDRVVAHSLLGRYYVAAKQPEAARPHLEYTAQHGSKHHLRAEAKELLKSL